MKIFLNNLNAFTDVKLVNVIRIRLRYLKRNIIKNYSMIKKMHYLHLISDPHLIFKENIKLTVGMFLHDVLV